MKILLLLSIGLVCNGLAAAQDRPAVTEPAKTGDEKDDGGFLQRLFEPITSMHREKPCLISSTGEINETVLEKARKYSPFSLPPMIRHAAECGQIPKDRCANVGQLIGKQICIMMHDDMCMKQAQPLDLFQKIQATVCPEGLEPRRLNVLGSKLMQYLKGLIATGSTAAARSALQTLKFYIRALPELSASLLRGIEMERQDLADLREGLKGVGLGRIFREIAEVVTEKIRDVPVESLSGKELLDGDTDSLKGLKSMPRAERTTLVKKAMAEIKARKPEGKAKRDIESTRRMQKEAKLSIPVAVIDLSDSLRPAEEMDEEAAAALVDAPEMIACFGSRELEQMPVAGLCKPVVENEEDPYCDDVMPKTALEEICAGHVASGRSPCLKAAAAISSVDSEMAEMDCSQKLQFAREMNKEGVAMSEQLRKKLKDSCQQCVEENVQANIDIRSVIKHVATSVIKNAVSDLNPHCENMGRTEQSDTEDDQRDDMLRTCVYNSTVPLSKLGELLRFAKAEFIDALEDSLACDNMAVLARNCDPDVFEKIIRKCINHRGGSASDLTAEDLKEAGHLIEFLPEEDAMAVEENPNYEAAGAEMMEAAEAVDETRKSGRCGSKLRAAADLVRRVADRIAAKRDAGSSSGTRKKRQTGGALLGCADIDKATGGVPLPQRPLADYSRLSPGILDNCTELLNQDGYNTTHVATLAQFVRDNAGDPSTWSHEFTRKLGVVLCGLEFGDLSKINFTRDDIVAAIRDRETVGDDFKQKYMMVHEQIMMQRAAGESLTPHLVQLMGRILRGAPDYQFTNMENTTYLATSAVLGGIRRFSPEQKASLCSTAKRSYDAAPRDWSLAQIEESGAALSGCTPEEVAALSADQLAVMSPTTAAELDENHWNAVVNAPGDKASALSQEQVAQIPPHTFERMSPEARSRLQSILDPGSSSAHTTAEPHQPQQSQQPQQQQQSEQPHQPGPTTTVRAVNHAPTTAAPGQPQQPGSVTTTRAVANPQPQASTTTAARANPGGATTTTAAKADPGGTTTARSAAGEGTTTKKSDSGSGAKTTTAASGGNKETTSKKSAVGVQTTQPTRMPDTMTRPRTTLPPRTMSADAPIAQYDGDVPTHFFKNIRPDQLNTPEAARDLMGKDLDRSKQLVVGETVKEALQNRIPPGGAINNDTGRMIFTYGSLAGKKASSKLNGDAFEGAVRASKTAAQESGSSFEVCKDDADKTVCALLFRDSSAEYVKENPDDLKTLKFVAKVWPPAQTAEVLDAIPNMGDKQLEDLSGSELEPEQCKMVIKKHRADQNVNVTALDEAGWNEMLTKYNKLDCASALSARDIKGVSPAVGMNILKNTKSEVSKRKEASLMSKSPRPNEGSVKNPAMAEAAEAVRGGGLTTLSDVDIQTFTAAGTIRASDIKELGVKACAATKSDIENGNLAYRPGVGCTWFETCKSTIGFNGETADSRFGALTTCASAADISSLGTEETFYKAAKRVCQNQHALTDSQLSDWVGQLKKRVDANPNDNKDATKLSDCGCLFARLPADHVANITLTADVCKGYVCMDQSQSTDYDGQVRPMMKKCEAYLGDMELVCDDSMSSTWTDRAPSAEFTADDAILPCVRARKNMYKLQKGVGDASARKESLKCAKTDTAAGGLSNLTDRANLAELSSFCADFTDEDWTSITDEVLCEMLSAVSQDFATLRQKRKLREVHGVVDSAATSGEGKCLGKLLEAAKSATCGGTAAAGTRRRRRRNADNVITCDEVKQMGQSVATLATTYFSGMTTADFTDCAEVLGQVEDFTDAHWEALAAKAKTAWNSDASKWTADQIRMAGGVVSGLSAADIEKLVLDDIDSVAAIGDNGKWSNEKTIAGFKAFKGNYGKTPEELTGTELQLIGHLACGPTTDDIKKITPASYCDAASDIGVLESCDTMQLTAYAEHAKNGACHGDVSGWSSGNVQSVGNVIGGLGKDNLGKLTSGHIKTLKPWSIKMIPHENVDGFTAAQLQVMGATQASSFNQQQLDALPEDKRKIVMAIATGVDDSGSGGDGGGDSGCGFPEASFMVLLTTFLAAVLRI